MSALDTYYKHVGKFKLLTKEQEFNLAEKTKNGCSYSRDLLVESNLRLALHIANKYRKTGFNMEEIIQEANIGLLKAVDRFDHTLGFRFSTYATWWIKQSILRYISKQGHVKFASSARKKIYEINRVRKEYNDEFGVYPDDHEVAELLGMKKDKVSAIRISMQWPVNLNSPMKGQEGRTYAEVIPEDNPVNVDQIIDRELIMKAIRQSLSSLKPVEERVLRLRFGLLEDPENNEEFPITQNELKNITNQ